MLRLHTRAFLMGLAVSAGLFGCAHHDAAVTAQAAQSAQQIGARLAAADKANEEAHRAAIARLIRIDGVHVREDDRTLRIAFTVHNLTAKAIHSLEFGFESDAPNGERIGSAELRSSTSIDAKTAKAIVLEVPYTQFGSDTGPMREAAGKPQRYSLDAKEIRYTNGTDAGYDD